MTETELVAISKFATKKLRAFLVAKYGKSYGHMLKSVSEAVVTWVEAQEKRK